MEKKLTKYPIGEQSFLQIRQGDYLYVDKTEFIEKVISGSKYFFLGRPRRFGKSLFLSTLKFFFLGRRDLFRGLYIDSVDWDWEEYPVFHLDLNNSRYQSEDSLDAIVDVFLREKEEKYGVEPIGNHSIRFSRVIKAAAEKTGRGVVILVDEYDKPLVNNIHNHERFEFYRGQLAELYSNFKNSADYIRLVFLTGVSRFGKLSVFSGLNNINDISFDEEYASICGITGEELRSYFKEGIESLNQITHRSFDEEVDQLKKYYDGYHFSIDCPDIYNPFSLLNAFEKKRYSNYWIESGTPTLLAEQLKKTNYNLEDIMSVKCEQENLIGLDINSDDPIPLFYQTGYLTIKDYNSKYDLYTLSIPNEEVKRGFFKFILPYYVNIRQSGVQTFVVDMSMDIEEGKVESFLKRLESFMAGISYEMRMEEEVNVQNAMLVLFTLIGLNVDVEYRTSDGRIDILIRADKYIYIIELKLDGTAEEALAQIEKKRYDLPWSADSRTIFAIGINFSSITRRMESFLVR